ncbi:MAG: formate--phosphoribosylaminoimidazolecarboxamide ligase [Candidatus Bathyarchaeia archaeon]
MISKVEIDSIIAKYDPARIKIATLCSHSALQIFHGAKEEGFQTVGICVKSAKLAYEAFIRARPDEFLLVDDSREVVNENIQEQLIRKNVIVIPHGSFVEHVGANKLKSIFAVPMFGNRQSLEWESSRQKQSEWLKKAGLRLPREYGYASEIDGPVIVKLSGAKGGSGFFVAKSEKQFNIQVRQRIRKGLITKDDLAKAVIQELIPGVRYYPHYFCPIVEGNDTPTEPTRLELLGMDRRLEVIDESYRWSSDWQEQDSPFTVTGNQPAVLRESLLPDILQMGINTVGASTELFAPGIIGPFSLETVYHPSRGFVVFEISARIVAGTNLFPQGSSYSCYLYREPMSTGRRIAREIKIAAEKRQLHRVVS